jgi:hypothetical protein
VYIVLGFSKKSSKAIIGRYKSPDELRDIFVVDVVKRSVRRSSRLYVFQETTPEDPLAWYLVTFDLRTVSGKRSNKPRKPTIEYSAIKEHMLFRACAHVDMSTYICPEHEDVELLIKSLGVVEYKKPEYYVVVPLDSKAREYLRECFVSAFEKVYARILTMTIKAERADKRANRLREAVEKKLSALYEFQGVVARHREKFTSIGLDVEGFLGKISEEAARLRRRVEEKWSRVTTR